MIFAPSTYVEWSVSVQVNLVLHVRGSPGNKTSAMPSHHGLTIFVVHTFGYLPPYNV